MNLWDNEYWELKWKEEVWFGAHSSEITGISIKCYHFQKNGDTFKKIYA